VDNLRLQDISLNWQIEQQLNSSRSVVHNKEGKENRKAASTNRASKVNLSNTVEPTKDYKLYGQLKFVQAQPKLGEEGGQEEMPKGPNSPLTTWLKVQLREAWQRELEFKKVLKEVFGKSQETLST
jgi:hypothetical protein